MPPCIPSPRINGSTSFSLNSFLHHIDTPSVVRLLRNLVTLLSPDGRVHILELVMPARPSIARVLAQLDRGDYPRPVETWRALFRDVFESEVEEEYPLTGVGIVLWALPLLPWAQSVSFAATTFVAQPAPIDTPAETRSESTEPLAKSRPCRISVAIPVFNEEHGVAELLRRVGTVLDSQSGGPHQIVVVNDGSTDRTLEQLELAARADHRLVIVSLSRNFGHQAALTAALDYVNGDVAVLMDGDLQDPPEVIPDFVLQYQSGADVVYAQRVRRKESWPLRLSYYVFYRPMLRLSSVPLPLDSGDFGLMSRRVVDSIRSAPERNRFLRGLRSWAGFRQVGIEVERGERYAGSSKYSLLKLMRLASDGMFAFSIVPLRLRISRGCDQHCLGDGVRRLSGLRKTVAA